MWTSKKQNDLGNKFCMICQYQYHIHSSLTGYVNICGAKYGETKIRRKWIVLKDMVFSCSATKDDPKSFSFSIRGIDVEAADKKEVKMKGAFKLSKDGEVYLYIEVSQSYCSIAITVT